MNLTGKQVMAILIAVLSVLMVSTTNLNDLFGPTVAKYIVSAAGLLNLILGSVMAALTGQMPQDQQIKQVLAMPGVQNITVNEKASPALAQLAVDPTVDKIAPTAAAVDKVTETAAKKE